MPEFTEGKWRYLECSREIFAPATTADNNPFGFAIADISFDHDIPEKEKHANGRLIAAAPELYDTVCNLLDYAYEALRWAGGENETRGNAPNILRDIQEAQQLIDRINGKEANYEA